jgi:hypothetical protein
MEARIIVAPGGSVGALQFNGGGVMLGAGWQFSTDGNRLLAPNATDDAVTSILLGPAVAATGSITINSIPATGRTITINDGVRGPATFEYTNGSPSGGATAVAIGGSTIACAFNLAQAIQNTSINFGLDFADSNIIVLTNGVGGPVGNIAITTNGGTDVTVAGMSGGMAAGTIGGVPALQLNSPLALAANALDFDSVSSIQGDGTGNVAFTATTVLMSGATLDMGSGVLMLDGSSSIQSDSTGLMYITNTAVNVNGSPAFNGTIPTGKLPIFINGFCVGHT